MTTQRLVCDIRRVTYDGTPRTLPRTSEPVLVWLSYRVAVGWRSGACWVLDEGCVELKPGDEWASLSPLRGAAWRGDARSGNSALSCLMLTALQRVSQTRTGQRR